jgi:SAM-dependent methyltransferase
MFELTQEERTMRQEKEMSLEQAESIVKAQEHAKKFRHAWVAHAKKKNISNGPNPPTTHAIRFFKEVQAKSESQVTPSVIDLGIGCGMEALSYLKEGWKVHGVDCFQEIVQHVNGVFLSYSDNFTAECNTLQHIDLGQQIWDIVSCVTTFLHIPKEDFPVVFEKCVRAVKPGGLFAFDLFLKGHVWANEEECYFSKDEIDEKTKDNKFTLNGVELEIVWSQYYNEPTQVVLDVTQKKHGKTPVFEYKEFVCRVPQKISLSTSNLGDEDEGQKLHKVKPF